MITVGSEINGLPSDLVQDIGSMVITQSSASFPVTGVLNDLLAPPSSPVAVGSTATEGYEQITSFVDNQSEGLVYDNGQLIVQKAGRYFSTVAYATFTHSINSAVVGFVFGFERDGFTLFSQRPITAESPNNGRPVSISGGGFFDALEGDKLSVWLASSKSGDIMVTNANVTVMRKVF